MTSSELTTSPADVKVSVRPDWRLPVTLGISFLPWFVVVLFTGGIWSAVDFAAYALGVLGAGYGVVCLAIAGSARTQGLFLAPALGILTVSATGAFWLRVGLPLPWVWGVWLCLAIPGMVSLWTDRHSWSKQTLGYGRTLAGLSLLICAVYFLLPAKNDAVLRSDGSFNWIYVDTQHFYSIAAGIKSGEGKPKIPGSATADLKYHFAPYVPAAAISRLTNLPLGDALARVTRGASLWSLLLAAFGLGTLLSVRSTGEQFGGIMCVAGLFFYGSLLALFTNEVSSASYVTGAIVFNIPGTGVVADGGPFAHLVLGHSVLHGIGAIAAILALCLAQMECRTPSVWREGVLLLLPALVVPVNSVGALYCAGIVGILLIWGRAGRARQWLEAALMLGLFFLAWKIMGFADSSDAAGATIKHHFASEWWVVTVAFLIGMGFRILAFKWVRPLGDPVAGLFLATVLGLLTFSLMMQLEDGNERYGMYYLQCMFSILAFSRLRRGIWFTAERLRLSMEWTSLASTGLLVLGGIGAAIGILFRISHRHTGISGFGSKVVLVFAVALAFAALALLMRRSPAVASVASIVLLGVLSIGFLAWIAPWLNYGLGRMKLDVTMTSGEVAGLNRIHDLAKPNERFATNRHEIDSLASRRERSYAYTALSERPVLLEGYLDRGVNRLPWFKSMLRDNDMMFTTSDPETLRKLAESYQVHWLVARPGTDIALRRPLPAWLVEEANPGSLKIYRVD
jgi:hypothetical protein